MSEGKSARDIADEMGISRTAVNRHVRNVDRKIQWAWAYSELGADRPADYGRRIGRLPGGEKEPGQETPPEQPR
jgi:AcrR family transcriptional regulator